MNWRAPLLLASVLALPSCSSSSSSGGSACPDILPALPDGGTTTAGCYTLPSITVCEQSGSSETCKDACAEGEQSVGCYSSMGMPPAPEPDAALGCKAVPLPTPSGTLLYCCPCK